MNTDLITIKGIFISPVIDEIKEKGTEKDLIDLEKKLGALKFSLFKNYPVSYQVEAERVLCNILYGKYDKEAYIKFGKKSFNRFADSNIGKVMFNLFGNDPVQLISNAEKLYATVSMRMKVTSTKLSDNKYSIRFNNDPYPVGGTEGTLRGFMDKGEFNYQLEFVDHGEGDHEYILTWE